MGPGFPPKTSFSLWPIANYKFAPALATNLPPASLLNASRPSSPPLKQTRTILFGFLFSHNLIKRRRFSVRKGEFERVSKKATHFEQRRESEAVRTRGSSPDNFNCFATFNFSFKKTNAFASVFFTWWAVRDSNP